MAEYKLKEIIVEIKHSKSNDDWRSVQFSAKQLATILDNHPDLFPSLMLEADRMLEDPELVRIMIESEICAERYSNILCPAVEGVALRVLAARLNECYSVARSRDEEALRNAILHLENWLDFLGPMSGASVEAVLDALWRILELPNIADSDFSKEFVYEVWQLLIEAPRPSEPLFKRNFCRAYHLVGRGKAEFVLLELLIDLFPNKDTLTLLGQLAVSGEGAKSVLSAGGLGYACFLVLDSYSALRGGLRAVLNELRRHHDGEMVRTVETYLRECLEETDQDVE